MDMAASIQSVTEDAMLAIARQVHKETGMTRLVLAGGALGAALFAWHQLLDKPGSSVSVDRQKGSYLGPRSRLARSAPSSTALAAKYRRAATESDLLEEVVGLLAEEKIVGWFQSRMEFGPRAPGARSILGDPRSPKMQTTMNLKIKFRESFRPFAPIVLREEAHKSFGIDAKHESPYMLLVAPVLNEHRVSVIDAERETMKNDPDLCHRVNISRSSIPAVTHLDYSARLQTVDDGRNPRLAPTCAASPSCARQRTRTAAS
jgi:carbamoyltransferase